MDVYFSTSTTRSGEQSEMGIQLANILHDQYIRVVDFKYPTHEGEGVERHHSMSSELRGMQVTTKKT